VCFQIPRSCCYLILSSVSPFIFCSHFAMHFVSLVQWPIHCKDFLPNTRIRTRHSQRRKTKGNACIHRSKLGCNFCCATLSMFHSVHFLYPFRYILHPTNSTQTMPAPNGFRIASGVFGTSICLRSRSCHWWEPSGYFFGSILIL
jgi:hypothetical protein